MMTGIWTSYIFLQYLLYAYVKFRSYAWFWFQVLSWKYVIQFNLSKEYGAFVFRVEVYAVCSSETGFSSPLCGNIAH